jgi:hypothetical protein
MPTRRTVNTQAMLEAAESGQRGVRAAQERREAQSRDHVDSVEKIEQARYRSLGNARADREVAQRDRQLAEVERSNRMGEAMQQDRMDMELADRGLQATGASRADRLREEMARGSSQTAGGAQAKAGGAQDRAFGPQPAGMDQDQPTPEEMEGLERGRAQGGKPLEVADADRRTIAPTEQRQQAEQAKSVTSRMNAQANYLNAVRNFSQSKLKGDDEAMKAELKSLQQPIKEAARMFDLGKKGELSPNQWEDLKAQAGDVPDPQLQQEISTRFFGPALSRFMQARVSQASIQFMAVTGDLPDGDLVDFASPAMREFTAASTEMQNYLKAADTGGMLTRSLGINSMADRNKMVRKLTAQAMLQGKANPKPAGGASAIIPSQGGQRAIPAPGQQPGRGPVLQPGLTDLPAGADPNQRPGSPVQQALEQREQSAVDQQQRGDEQRRQSAINRGRPSYAQIRAAGL